MRSEPEPSSSALDWPGRTGTADLLLQELTARARVRRRRRAKVVSALTVFAVVAIGTSALWRRQSPRAPATATTLASAPRSTQQTLPDGSLVELKEGAQLTTDFSGTLRRVELTRGTAHFQVTKNPSRPFVVTAGGVAVRAVGTAFSVEVARGTVEVLVTEGSVAVEPSTLSETAAAHAPTQQLATVAAGAGVVLEVDSVASGAAPVVRAVPAAAIEEKLAWRSRQLELSGTPLAEVVAMLNRHAIGGGQRTRFAIADPEIEMVKLSGVIRTDKTDALVHLLEVECGVRAQRHDDGRIVLHKAR
jgi:transmembrane sensor